MTELPVPHPLFDTMDNFTDTPHTVASWIHSLGIPAALQEYRLCTEFLKSYLHSPDTFTAYRREVERFLQWAWLIQKKSLKDITRNDLRDFLNFVNKPPLNWIGYATVNRFVVDAMGNRVANSAWKPFVIKTSKVARRHGKLNKKSMYQLSNKSIEAIFAGLSSLFTFLQQETYLEVNPVSLIRQKKGYIQRHQTRKVTRKLSKLQWLHVVNAAEKMATENSEHERSYFLMSAFYLLGVRISELAYSEDRKALMGNFAPDKEGLWWFTTVGKGNKLRDIAVPDELLATLKRYRSHLNLTPLPARDEQTPLLPKLKGNEGLGTRQIRNLVQKVFDHAIASLIAENKQDEAEDLATATVHWLRHTAISNEIEFRPREHIRDDVGHENPATMDKYIDTDRLDRHHSAKGKRLKPE